MEITRRYFLEQLGWLTAATVSRHTGFATNSSKTALPKSSIADMKCTARVATKGAPAADQSIGGEALKDQRRT